jgi:hypothetical protein
MKRDANPDPQNAFWVIAEVNSASQRTICRGKITKKHRVYF